MSTHTNLLIDEEPLQVLPSLACKVGLHEAIVLQQIHYWLHPKRKSGKVVDGTRWIFNSYAQWKEQFPFLTEKVIGNAIRSLERQGYLLSRQDLNAVGSDRRKWYTIDYDSFRDVERPDSDDGHPYRDDGSPDSDVLLTETTTETTTESSVSSLRSDTGESAYPGQNVRTPSRRDDQESPEFDAFWRAYPRKKNKGDARKAWRSEKITPPMLPTILASIQAHCKTRDWQKDGGQFIPYPATWLRAHGWEDEPDTQIQKPHRFVV